MSIANHITTSLRLSCREAKIIRIGLFSIANGHELWRARGSPPYSPARMLFQRCRVDEGEYSAEDLATVSRVAATATFTSQSRRLRLDPLELAACAFGARVTEMQVRHGHIEAWLPNHTGASRKLLAKLERLRRRAKGAYIRVRGQAAFREASRRWQSFVRFARAYFLFCRCDRPRLPFGNRDVRRRFVQDLIEYFKEELSSTGLQVPAEKELHSLVRRGLRSARRLMADMGVMTVRRNRAFLFDRICSYVIDRCRGLKNEDGGPLNAKRFGQESFVKREKYSNEQR